MYDFIISGQVPGTELEVTFTMWAYVVALVLAVAMLIRVHNNRVISEYATAHIGSDAGSALKPLHR